MCTMVTQPLCLVVSVGQDFVQDCKGVMLHGANVQDVLDARREYLEVIWRWVGLYRRTKLEACCAENYYRKGQLL